jgi:hypothetical protein
MGVLATHDNVSALRRELDGILQEIGEDLKNPASTLIVGEAGNHRGCATLAAACDLAKCSWSAFDIDVGDYLRLSRLQHFLKNRPCKRIFIPVAGIFGPCAATRVIAARLVSTVSMNTPSVSSATAVARVYAAAHRRV